MVKRKRRNSNGITDDSDCPCGSGAPYGQCCGRLHRRAGEAITAVEVMRARYSAHVVGDHDYLLDTWHPDTRPDGVAGGTETWLGLELGETIRGGALDADGTVAFIARFRSGERIRALRETSSFVRLGGRWVYYDGKLEF